MVGSNGDCTDYLGVYSTSVHVCWTYWLPRKGNHHVHTCIHGWVLMYFCVYSRGEYVFFFSSVNVSNLYHTITFVYVYMWLKHLPSFLIEALDLYSQCLTLSFQTYVQFSFLGVCVCVCVFVCVCLCGLLFGTVSELGVARLIV